jgi:hypothetical protein
MKVAQPRLRVGLAIAATVCVCLAADAQKTQQEPATDTSTQASPIKPPPPAPTVDSSTQASPITPVHIGPGVSVTPHTPLHLRLNTAIDSGHLKNGQTIHATLTAPVTLSPHGTLGAGTPVELTVVETLPAGRISSAGEFSLQVLRLGSLSVYTDTLTFRGKPGHKDLPDSAPTVGTDAGLAAGASLTFHMQPPPSSAAKPAKSGTSGPGAVNGVASGGPPPPGSSTTPNKGQNGTNNTTSRGQARSVQPASNTPAPAQHLGQPSPAPNQPAPPQNSSPTSSTQPQ